jgi:hypothetical protein
MERWEKSGEPAEFWELTIDGTVLTEKVGAAGAEPVVRVQQCDTEAMAEGIRGRMAAQRERQGFRRVSGSEPEARAERPEFPGVPDAKIAEAIHRVAKAAGVSYRYDDNVRYRDAIQKAVGDWDLSFAVAWFLVEHRLIAAETMPGFWDLLAEHADLAAPEVAFAFLSRLPSGPAFESLFPQGRLAWFTDNATRALDVILFSAWRRSPALFDSRERELPASIRTLLDFVCGRSGMKLPAERARAVLAQIAGNQARRGLATNWEIPMLEPGGAVTMPRLADASVIRSIALRFGTEQEWRQAMVAAALASDQEASSAQIHDALVACSSVELATMLSREFSYGDNANLARELRLVEEERHDSPEALLEAAMTLKDRTDHGREIRELLAVVAARRFAEAGTCVPEALDSLLRFEFLSGVYFESIRPYVAGLKAIPRERVHALVEKQLAEPIYFGRALGALLAHPDEALLARIFEKDKPTGYSLEPEVVGRLGASVLPHLMAAWESTPRSSRRTRHQQILRALATAADAGEPFGPEWDRFIDFDMEGDERLKYWDPRHLELRVRALRGLPPDRRAAVLTARLEESRYPERIREAEKALA